LIYLQKLRIAAAKRLLESNYRTMGYQDVTFFPMLFQRHTGVSPSAYRERFGA
jgi:YesN/AraC family two-component response regulator